eukprot:347384-Chlamydomonas_euryale.AAC.7
MRDLSGSPPIAMHVCTIGTTVAFMPWLLSKFCGLLQYVKAGNRPLASNHTQPIPPPHMHLHTRSNTAHPSKRPHAHTFHPPLCATGGIRWPGVAAGPCSDADRGAWEAGSSAEVATRPRWPRRTHRGRHACAVHDAGGSAGV